jgi:serine/threonine protein kinase
MAPDGPRSSGSSGPASAFDWESVLHIIEHIVYGLTYIHDEGVVHRDLKPANGNHLLSVKSFFILMNLVLFSKKDNCWKLADFGTASHATSKRLNTTRDSRGTAGYRAPETLNEDDARFNQKSDIFALGCILYELVTGEKLFTNDWASLSYSKTGELPKSVWWPVSLTLEPDRLNAFEVLVSSMIEVQPSSRPNAREVQNSLESIRVGDCIAPQPRRSSQGPVHVFHHSCFSLQQRYLSDPKTEQPIEPEIPAHHDFPRQLPFLREIQNTPTPSSSREEVVSRPGNLPTSRTSVQQQRNLAPAGKKSIP